MKISIKSIKKGLLDGIPMIDYSSQLQFGRYKGSYISNLANTRPSYLLWLERNSYIVLEQTLRNKMKETVRKTNMRDAMFDSMYDNDFDDSDDYGLTAYDLGADV